MNKQNGEIFTVKTFSRIKSPWSESSFERNFLTPIYQPSSLTTNTRCEERPSQ